LISLGTGGIKPSLQAFGADQFDEEDKTEMLKRSSFFNLWYFGVLNGLLLAVTVIAYVEDNVSWGLGFGIVTVAMAMASVVFLYGTPFYRHKLPGGSPITSIAQVVVAAIRKRNIMMPSDMNLLYEDPDAESIKSGQRHLSHTDHFQ
jgi:peptide/histidine transporter 3/4